MVVTPPGIVISVSLDPLNAASAMLVTLPGAM
jgi:hypothetical protein